MSVPDAYTVCLLHLNGANGSTVFTDESGKVWTANGNAQISTAQSKLGGASALFDGASDWTDTPDSADFNFGTGDLTIDFWVRKSIDSTELFIFGQNNSSQADFSIESRINGVSNLLTVWVNVGGVDHYFDSTTALSINTWYHIAFVRYGNSFLLFINGVLENSNSYSGSIFNSSSKFSIGRKGEYATSPFNGYIDEFRISKGIARWISNFTPPAYEYGNEFIPRIIMIGE